MIMKALRNSMDIRFFFDIQHAKIVATLCVVMLRLKFFFQYFKFFMHCHLSPPIVAKYNFIKRITTYSISKNFIVFRFFIKREGWLCGKSVLFFFLLHVEGFTRELNDVLLFVCIIFMVQSKVQRIHHCFVVEHWEHTSTYTTNWTLY